jgi:DNA invertase Pin-like site-specific DNA recombinase
MHPVIQRASKAAADTFETKKPRRIAPGGRLVFHIFGSIAEFERAIIRG